MKVNSILWLTQGKETLPSVRFRVIPIAEELQKYDININVLRYRKTISQRISFFAQNLFKTKKYDVCIVQKRILHPAEISALKIISKKIVFDFDDAIWTDQEEAAQPGRGKKWSRFNRMLTHMDLVIAGNSYLAEAAKGAPPVFILPTPIDTSVYTPGTSDMRTKKFTIGWMGTSSYLAGLSNIAEMLHAVTGDPIQIVSNMPPTGNFSIHTQFNKWTPENELPLLQKFSVGLMPLNDDPYTRGKCGFKLLQYMSCGVVPIASSVGFNKEIISHGVDGFLVTRENQWKEFAFTLFNDRNLLEQMAQKARLKVVNRFDITQSSKELLKIIDSI